MLNRILRSFYYFRTGYSIYLSLPLTLINLCTTIYYLAIQNIPAVKQFFPGFIEFGLALVVLVYPAGALAGYIHFKRAPFYKLEQAINVESNPYSQDHLTPVMIPMWRAIIALAERENIDVEEMRRILEKSI